MQTLLCDLQVSSYNALIITIFIIIPLLSDNPVFSEEPVAELGWHIC